jgi:hypothetical protein
MTIKSPPRRIRTEGKKSFKTRPVSAQSSKIVRFAGEAVRFAPLGAERNGLLPGEMNGLDHYFAS